MVLYPVRNAIRLCDYTSSVSNDMHKSRSLCWMAAIFDLYENRTFAMEGFMGIFNVDTNPTNELILGEKPFTGILCNLGCVYLPDYVWLCCSKVQTAGSVLQCPPSPQSAHRGS